MKNLVLCAAGLAMLGAPAASGSAYLIARGADLESSAPTRLVMLPDGRVFHLARLKLRALFEVYSPADSLIYDIEQDAIVVRRNVAPSDLLLVEPLTPILAVPTLFRGINVAKTVALFDPATSFFYASFPGVAYPSGELNGSDRLLYVGDIVDVYRDYQPQSNPFEPDSDFDGIPNIADNCLATANGPGDTAVAGPAQNDTDLDGFGNPCDADLNNDCIVNSLDLGIFKTQFFATGPNSADFNGDGVVNAIDLGTLRSLFFTSPGPSGTAVCP